MLNFLLLQDIDETAGWGNNRIISVRHSQTACGADLLSARKPTLAPSLIGNW